MPFFKSQVFYQGHSVNLRSETCVLLFEETCFFLEKFTVSYTTIFIFIRLCIGICIDSLFWVKLW